MKARAISPGKRAWRRLSAFWRDERGTSTIEFALASIPVFIVFLVAIEFGLDMTVDATVQIAAQAASRAGMTTMTPSTTPDTPTAQATAEAAARAIVMRYLTIWQNIGATVTVTRSDYSAYGGTASSGSSYCGNVESYVIQVTNLPAFTGVASWLGLSPPTYERNFIVQNVCTTS